MLALTERKKERNQGEGDWWRLKGLGKKMGGLNWGGGRLSNENGSATKILRWVDGRKTSEAMGGGGVHNPHE